MPRGARCSITATRPPVVSADDLTVASSPRNHSVSPSPAPSAIGATVGVPLSTCWSSPSSCSIRRGGAGLVDGRMVVSYGWLFDPSIAGIFRADRPPDDHGHNRAPATRPCRMRQDALDQSRRLSISSLAVRLQGTVHTGSMGPTSSGVTMSGSSTEGIKTVLHPVSDLAAAKAVYTALLGGPPQPEAPYYVGLRGRGPAHRAGARRGRAGHDLAGGLLACAGHRGEARRSDRCGCHSQGARARRRRRPPGGHRHRPRRQRARAASVSKTAFAPGDPVRRGSGRRAGRVRTRTPKTSRGSPAIGRTMSNDATTTARPSHVADSHDSSACTARG